MSKEQNKNNKVAILLVAIPVAISAFSAIAVEAVKILPTLLKSDSSKPTTDDSPGGKAEHSDVTKPGSKNHTSSPITKVQANYVCQQINGELATVAKTPQGDVSLIKWKSYVSPEWTPEQRCQTVSARFQEYENQKQLNYITTGQMNGQNIICIGIPEQGCNLQLKENGLLLTVTGDKQPNEVLTNLLGLTRYEALPSIDESAGERLYINIHKLIQERLPEASHCFGPGCQAQKP